MSLLTLVLDDSISPFCDHCGGPWPTTNGQQLPGGHRWDGHDESGKPIIRLFCSALCEQADLQERP